MSKTPSLTDIVLERLEENADPKRKEKAHQYFKSGKGEYGEGDRFVGTPVPAQRQIAKDLYKDTGLEELGLLLRHPIHEMRLTGVFILVNKMKRAKRVEDQKPLVDLYLSNLEGINNWDLVDSSAPHILGPWTLEQDLSIIDELANSGELWKERIAVLATQYHIKQSRYGQTLDLAEKLIDHDHDLIHKAVGWMLREIGERDPGVEMDFLDRHYHKMPRTMLRYAIEKFPEETRQAYLRGDR